MLILLCTAVVGYFIARFYLMCSYTSGKLLSNNMPNENSIAYGLILEEKSKLDNVYYNSLFNDLIAFVALITDAKNMTEDDKEIVDEFIADPSTTNYNRMISIDVNYDANSKYAQTLNLVSTTATAELISGTQKDVIASEVTLAKAKAKLGVNVTDDEKNLITLYDLDTFATVLTTDQQIAVTTAINALKISSPYPMFLLPKQKNALKAQYDVIQDKTGALYGFDKNLVDAYDVANTSLSALSEALVTAFNTAVNKLVPLSGNDALLTTDQKNAISSDALVAASTSALYKAYIAQSSYTTNQITLINGKIDTKNKTAANVSFNLDITELLEKFDDVNHAHMLAIKSKSASDIFNLQYNCHN